MESKLVQKMAQLLVDIAETNSEILAKLSATSNEYEKMKSRIELLEGYKVAKK